MPKTANRNNAETVATAAAAIFGNARQIAKTIAIIKSDLVIWSIL